MVPVDGSHASMQAVSLACDIARKNRGSVYIIHVIEVKRALPLDAELEVEVSAGEVMLKEAEQVARGQDFEVEGEILKARESGHAIVDQAINRAVDLIVLGMEYQQPFGEFQIGGVIQYVLKSAPCEVWLCRHPLQE